MTHIYFLASITLWAALPVWAQEPTRNTTRLEQSRTCEQCSIRLTPEVTLGVGTDEWGGVTRGVFARDGRGRYYHVSAYSPFVLLAFDSGGGFLRPIGRQGKGPGEFSNIGRVIVGRGDTLHVFDQVARTYTVISPTYQTARSTTLGPRVWSAVELEPGKIVVGAEVGTRDRFGYPLHHVRGTELGDAFGGRDAIQGKPRPAPLELLRLLARQSDTTFWAGRGTQYVIELWTADGKLLRRLERDVMRDAPWFRQADRSTLDGRLNPILHAMDIDESGLLWVVFKVRDLRWRERIETVRSGLAGVPQLRSKTGDLFDLNDSIVEVIDPIRAEVLATLRSDRLIESFAGPRRLVIYQQDSLGVGQLVVHRAELIRPGGRQ